MYYGQYNQLVCVCVCVCVCGTFPGVRDLEYQRTCLLPLPGPSGPIIPTTTTTITTITTTADGIPGTSLAKLTNSVAIAAVAIHIGLPDKSSTIPLDVPSKPPTVLLFASSPRVHKHCRSPAHTRSVASLTCFGDFELKGRTGPPTFACARRA